MYSLIHTSIIRFLLVFIAPLIGLIPLSQKTQAQSITISAPFDPSLPVGTVDEGQSLGMQTYFDAVSADGKTAVGHAWEFVEVVSIPDDEGKPYFYVDFKIVTIKWRDGVFTKLPFYYPGREDADSNLLGISADGNRIYGVTNKDGFLQPNPPIGVYENGAVTAANFGPWVNFAPGLQGRTKPTGGWVGKSANTNERVIAVSDDFKVFVGNSRSSPTSLMTAKIWTVDEVISIPPTDGFTQSEATGVSSDGRIVCGTFTLHPNEGYTGDAGFIWTKNSGPILLRSMVHDQGFPFDTNFPNINAMAISGDGGTVVGTTDGVDTTGRDYGFRQLLGPSVSIRLPESPYSVDEPFKAEITVFSPTKQPQTISFSGAVLTSPDGKCEFEFVEGEDPVKPFTLSQSEQSRTFNVMVTPRDSGTLHLATEVKAVSTKGTLNLTDSAEFYITPLKVTVVMKPLVNAEPILNLKLDDNGIITDSAGKPVTPKVEVTVENLSSTPLVGALQAVDPRARDRSTALGRIETLAEFPMDFPSIVKGVPIKREIDLKINEDGRFEFVALVTAREQDGTHGFTAVGRGAPLAVGEPFQVEMEIKMVRTAAITNQNNGAIFVQPGSAVQFLATIKNLTTNSTIEFYGMDAEKKLNVQGCRLTDDVGNQFDPPFVHSYSLDSGSSEVLSCYVKTEIDGASSGTLTWQGFKDFKMVDDATGEETELDMKDVLVKSTVTGWLGNDLSLRVIQDHSQPEPTILSGLELTSLRAGYFSYGALLQVGAWAYDSVDAIGGVGRFAGNITGNPSAFAEAWGEGSRAVWEMGEYAARTWQKMDQKRRDDFVALVAQEGFARAVLLDITRRPFDTEDPAASIRWAQQATYGFFGGLETAYASNDPKQIAQVWGEVSGRTGVEIATALLPTPKFQEYSKTAEALLLATNLDAARFITKQDDLLRTLKTGFVGSETVLKAWGIGGQHLDEIQKLFSKFKVKGYLRERSPRAFELIDQLKDAVWKPELMKPKGISEIDLLILEDASILPRALGAQGNDLGLDGITAIFLPEADEIIAPRVRSRLIARGNYPLEDIEEAVQASLARAQKRREEFAEYVPEFEKWAADTVVNNGGIPVARNYIDNGVPNPEGFENAKRGFMFARHNLPNGRAMYIPKMKDSTGIFRYISGDVDWIHFTFLNGLPLDSKTAGRLYDAMFRCCGLQHPETISWILNKQTIFKGKVNQLTEYLTGKKALLEVSGDSTRAVNINEQFTRLAKNGRDHLLFFNGGIKARIGASLADAEGALAYYQQRFPDRRVLLPFLGVSNFNAALNRAGAADGDWTYSSTENDSVILRENADGAYETFDGLNWLPWNPISQPGVRTREVKSNKIIHLSPTSSLAENAPAGSNQPNVVDLPAQWPTELTGHVSNWLAAGQTIVIAPGELTQEVHLIAAMGPLKLTSSMKYAHPKNTMVAVVPPRLSIVDVSPTASTLLSTVIDPVRGIVTMIWRSLPNRQYTLETASPTIPSVWSAVLTGLSSTEEVLAFEIPLDDYDGTFTYRLRNTGATDPATEFKIISSSINQSAGTVTLVWTSIPGTEYVVERSRDFTSDAWAAMTPTVTAPGQTSSLILPLDPQVKKAFFRVRNLAVTPRN